MKTSTKQINKNLNLPLKSLRLVSRYPKENKVIIEINLTSLEEENEPGTIDELISRSKADFLLGNYKSFSSAESLIADLRS